MASSSPASANSSMISLKNAERNRRGSANSIPRGDSTSITVAVRCRPFNELEKKGDSSLAITCLPDSNSVKLSESHHGNHAKKPEKKYNFDHVFGMYSRQDEIFESVGKPSVRETINGYNCTIFAYGPSGTGKTHTIEGDANDQEQWGMIPRAAKMIFDEMEAMKADFNLKVSYLEIYNEELGDLLNTGHTKQRLKLVEDLKRGVITQNLEEIPVENMAECMDLLHNGMHSRHVAATLNNEFSSRSHAIFTFRLTVKKSHATTGEELVTTGQLNLVDLAGSESIGRSGAANERAKEAGSINQSLLTLGRVITALVDRQPHVPYRDSKLTRLLQESLGGKAKTCIIATLSPSMLVHEESNSTLEYALRAKNVKNQPTANTMIAEKVVMKEKFIEIEQLKSQLAATREKNGVYLKPEDFHSMEAKIQTQKSHLQELQSTLQQREEEIKNVKKDKTELEMNLIDTQRELENTDMLLEEMTKNFEQTKNELKHTFVELRATEAVVGEQTNTESALLEHGEGLQNDLAACQGDVSKLLEKVDRMAKSEEQKLTDTAKFVTELAGSSDALADAVDTMACLSQDNSSSLSKGVAQMLHQGRTTTATLKENIDSALSAMINDAEVAKEGMTQSCNGLKAHLGTTNSQVGASLKKMQVQLAEWMEEVDANLQQAQTLLTQQHNQINSATSVVSHHCTQIKEQVDSYFSKEEALKMDSVRNLDTLRLEIERRLDFFQKEAQQHSEKSQLALKGKAEAMETALKNMLSELMKSSSQALDATVTRASSAIADVQQRVSDGQEQLTDSLEAISESALEHVQAVNAQTDATRSGYMDDILEAENTRVNVSDTLTGVEEDVGAKKKSLDGLISDLVDDIDQAIKKGCKVVDDTTVAADKLVADVGTASDKMNGLVGESMTEFNQFLDKEGEEVSSQLNAHFSAVKTHLQEQTKGLGEIKENSAQHAEHMSGSAIKPTASTPRSLRRSKNLENSLQCTRDHANIKVETRNTLLADVETKLMLFRAESNFSLLTSTDKSVQRLSDTDLAVDSNGSELDDVTKASALKNSPLKSALRNDADGVDIPTIINDHDSVHDVSNDAGNSEANGD